MTTITSEELHYQIIEAYLEGRRDMQREIIDRLGDYEANKCAQIAASVPVDPKDAG